MRRWAICVGVTLVLAARALATGFMMPDDRRLSCLQLESHRVTASIEDRSAVTKVAEVFRNQHDRQLEATFVFPLPEGASVSGFKMYVNGKLVTGEIMDAGEARRTYQQIVAQMRDPGLLEYIDSRLMKMSVFPILPRSTQEVRIEYSETLNADNGLVEYVYPLRTPQAAAKTLDDFTLAVDITARAGIKNVYSPSHDVSIHRVDDTHVKASFEKTRAALDKDFHLFYSLTDKAFGASVISYRSAGKDGYFLMLVSPKVKIEEKEIAPKDVAFVLDTSGSMKGDKLEQARRALSFCVTSLNDADRFTIVSFSDEARPLSVEMLSSNSDNRAKAKAFIDDLKAAGGTDINIALSATLNMQEDSKRPFIVVFLTDGLPTIGETDINKIIRTVEDKSRSSARVFCFGVGDDVNTKLLDQLAQVTNATNQYVHPEEDIEVKVSSFFSKVGAPLLSQVEISYGSADVYDVYPKKAGDLFRGGEIVIAGRYKKAGSTTVVLKGKSASGEAAFEYQVSFSDSGNSKKFISNIWAGRKIAYLLGEIRLHGENEELKDEVVRLSKDFGIVTPYTSYFAKEAPPVPQPAIDRLRSLGYIGGDRMTEAREASAPRPLPSTAASAAPHEIDLYRSADKASTGESAVRASEAYSRLMRNDKATEGREMRSASGRTFVNMGGVWADNTVTKDLQIVHVKFASEAYFRIVDSAPRLREAFALGDKLVLKAGKYCLVIDDDGEESLENANVKAVSAALGGK